jgi:hypothetical protein
VWAAYVKGNPLEHEWDRIDKLNEHRKKEEPAEENFCHAFAAYYVKYPPIVHSHPEWKRFIKNLPQ